MESKMRKIILAAVSALFVTISMSSAFAGPPCTTNHGGMCESDYDQNMRSQWIGNGHHMVMPVSPGGYGLLPNGRPFYPSQMGMNGGQVGRAVGMIAGPVLGRLFGHGARFGGQSIARPVATPQLVPIGPVIQHPANISGLVCKRTYSDGRVEMYPGLCHG
jgi:hypothetical protein